MLESCNIQSHAQSKKQTTKKKLSDNQIKPFRFYNAKKCSILANKPTFLLITRRSVIRGCQCPKLWENCRGLLWHKYHRLYVCIL